MKATQFLLLLLIAFSFSCSNYYDHIIESDYSYQGTFNRYKTFDFAAREGFEGTELQKQAIEKFLETNMEQLGYNRKKNKPNLIIFYNLYYEDLSFQGYKQPNFENWLKWNFSKKIIAKKQDSLVAVDDYLSQKNNNQDEDYNRIRYTLQEGTLLISMYDRRKNNTIWQGYASGIIGEDEFQNERIIRHIVSRIMDKYRVLAVGSVSL